MNVQFSINQNLDENLILLEAKERTEFISSLIKDIEQTNRYLECISSQGNFLRPTADFSVIYSANKKVFGKIKEEEVTLKYRLYELESMLPKQFVRISNTEIVNIDDVLKFELTTSGIIIVILKDGTQTSSSRRYLNKIKERLT